MKMFLPVAAVVCLAGSGAFAQGTMSKPSQTPAPTSGGMASDMTNTFVMNTQAGTHLEINDSQMAMKQAQAKSVKSFAAKMVKDHTMWAKTLAMAIKSDKAAMLPDDTPPMADQTAMMNQLQGLNGAAFDKAYVDQMVMAHQKDAQAFTDYAMNGDDPKIKAVAKKTLPGIKMHLSMITKIQKDMTKTAGL